MTDAMIDWDTLPEPLWDELRHRNSWADVSAWPIYDTVKFLSEHGWRVERCDGRLIFVEVQDDPS